jgi:hypothetical protein
MEYVFASFMIGFASGWAGSMLCYDHLRMETQYGELIKMKVNVDKIQYLMQVCIDADRNILRQLQCIEKVRENCIE